MVYGVLDSVKIISLQAYNNGIPVNDWYNNKELILSKNHGWIKTLDFYRFPNPLIQFFTLGARIDSTQHFRLNNTIKSINLNNKPLSRYAPGNEWISKTQWKYGASGATPTPPFSVSFRHDSVITVQPTVPGVIATIQTHIAELFGTPYFKDTTFIHKDTITEAVATSLTDTILPEYNWNLQHIDSDILALDNSDYYLRYYNVDTFCQGLYEIFSGGTGTSSTIVVLFKDSTNCIRPNAPALLYPATREWKYLQGFGYTYRYHFWISGEMIYSYDETNYTYIKLGSCTIGTKGPLSVAEESDVLNQVNIFPNPAKDVITVQFPFKQQKTFIEIYDASGKKMLSDAMNDTALRMNISHLTPGIYFVRMITASGVLAKKILVIQ